MFAESIQGVGGTVQYPKGYIKKAAKLVRANGGVFISDEVQSGFGRTGDHFWGFQEHGIIPDIVTCAKGIGNGFPIGAVITTPEIAQCLDRALHFNTFGGNPLASAVGMAVLDVIEEEELQKNSKIVGTRLIKGLLELQKKYEIIGDTLRIKPPMCISQDDAQLTLEALEKVLMLHHSKRRRNSLR
uniref:Alanine--glyoxylate aminotransferase 2, mitochondrial n=1 Tax=Phlebotomus papatasi TaxID=29031 RepID=A0A1B0GNV4_PHLPP